MGTAGIKAETHLQLTASVAPLQDMRLHAGCGVYLTLGCNTECSIYAHGHLNLMRGRRHLGLRSKLTALEPGHAQRIALSLSHVNLSAVHHALDAHQAVKAAMEVEARSGDERLDLQRRGAVELAVRLARWLPWQVDQKVGQYRVCTWYHDWPTGNLYRSGE